ncbi:MAG: Na/Pi cotransporter family protein [Lentisphaerae bacterium]|nr:Na/Pi cotransporter family protein [Lentisphaerota bacterium]
MSLMQFMTVFGGLAIFIFGMKLMSDGLHHVAGEKMRSILQMFSANRFVAVLSGAAVTCVIQSSSATTVMVVGFINAGLLNLVQGIGLMFGAHIGTTITAQLVAFKISWIIMPAIILGLLLSFVPRPRVAKWSETILGFGFLFLGMETMSGTLKKIDKALFESAFQFFDCGLVDGMIPVLPLLGAIVVGMIVTMIVQSSSACTGIIIALGASKLLNIETAVALTLGSNIGTTITAQLAALTANRVAKQAALANSLSNIVGVTVVCLTFLIPCNGQPVFFALIDAIGGDTARQIANAHTAFNVFTTLLLLPFIPLFAKVCEKLIPVKNSKVKFERLERHLLDTPSIALTQTSSALRQMLKKSWKMIDCALNVYNRNDEKNQQVDRQLAKREADIDDRQQAITEYLSQLMTRQLTKKESEQIPMMLHCTNDVERIGDHAELIRAIIARLQNDGLKFSADAETEYDDLHDNLAEFALITLNLLERPTAELQEEADRQNEKIQSMLNRSEAEHFNRISNGECRPEVGILFLELVEEIRKIARHLENINDRASMFYGKFPDADERI